VVSGLPVPALAEAIDDGNIVLVEQDDEGQDVGSGNKLDANLNAWFEEFKNTEAYAAIMQVVETAKVNLSDEAIVEKARAAYDSLSQQQKQLMETIAPKVDECIAKAEASIAEQKEKAAAQIQGFKDSEAYAAIKQALELAKVNLSDEAIVEKARAAYDSLSQQQKMLIEAVTPQVSQRLAEAEAVLAELKKPAQIIIALDTTVAMGTKANLGALTTGDGTLVYKSSDETVATVSADGVVTPVSIGTAKIIITATSTNKYRKTIKKINIAVTQGKQTVTAKDKSVSVNKTVKLTAKTSGDGALTYKSSNKAIATVTSKGTVKGVKPGNVIITITAAATTNYKKASKSIIVSVSKGANTLTAKAKKATVSASAAKAAKGAVTLASNITVTKAVGKVTYANASTNATAKKFVVNATTGKVTVPKGTKKGTYQVKVKVTAKGDASYLKGTKTVSYKVQVK
jgi:FixJ family two-component response regulator